MNNIIFVTIAFLLVLTGCAYFGSLYGRYSERLRQEKYRKELVDNLTNFMMDSEKNGTSHDFLVGISASFEFVKEFIEKSKGGK